MESASSVLVAATIEYVNGVEATRAIGTLIAM
jgi:hypothetical protein